MSSEKKSLKEKPGVTAAKFSEEGKIDFMGLCGRLQHDTEKIAVDFAEKVVQIETVNAQKERAKSNYRAALDSGLESKMSASLAEIRERNQEAEKLKTELAEFAATIKELYARRTKIFDVAKAGQLKAAARVREAEELLKSAAERVRFSHGLRELINSLNTEVSEILRGFEKSERKTSEAEVEIPRRNENGFWLEVSDPFGEGTLRYLRELKGDAGLVLPIELSFRDRETAPIDGERLKKQFEKSEKLKSEFGDVQKYLDFKSKIVVQILESYILRSAGAGERRREMAAKVALRRCR